MSSYYDYIGKVCPYCKTKFKPGDDIVVCSNCDMPHHKECWIENQGCSTFGCLGTIKTVDGSPTSVTSTQMNYNDSAAESGATVYCTKCGAPNSSSSAFCTKCGSRLTTEAAKKAPVQHQQPPVYTQADPSNSNPYSYVNQPPVNQYQQPGGYSQPGFNTAAYSSANDDAALRQLIGGNSEYYLPKFQQMKAQGSKTSWNWAAFLFAPYWMAYRRMYGYGIGVLAVSFIFLMINSLLMSVLLLAGYVAIGVYGNYIYIKSLEEKKQRLQTMTEPMRSQFITQNSGVNTTAAVLCVAAYVVLVIIRFVSIAG